MSMDILRGLNLASTLSLSRLSFIDWTDLIESESVNNL